MKKKFITLSILIMLTFSLMTVGKTSVFLKIKTTLIGCTYGVKLTFSDGTTKNHSASASGTGSNAADCDAAFNQVQDYCYKTYGICIPRREE